MALPARQENPIDIAATLLANQDEADPDTIATLIGEIGRLQEEALVQLETAMDRGRPLRLDQALGHFAATGPILGYGRVIAEPRRLYMVKV